MSLVRDNNSQNAVLPLAALTTFVAAAGATNTSAAVDTSGFSAAMFALGTDRALAAADITTFVYTFEDSDDGSTDWQEVPEDAVLPARKVPGNAFVIAQGGYLQTVGVFSTRKFVRLSVTGTADTTNLIITPTVFLESDEVEFTGYDLASVPGDGLP
jgi:hypothetical protein